MWTREPPLLRRKTVAANRKATINWPKWGTLSHQSRTQHALHSPLVWKPYFPIFVVVVFALSRINRNFWASWATQATWAGRTSRQSFVVRGKDFKDPQNTTSNVTGAFTNAAVNIVDCFQLVLQQLEPTERPAHQPGQRKRRGRESVRGRRSTAGWW